MKFHTLQFQLTGYAKPFADATHDEITDLDIADVFADLSRSFGFEGKIDTYAGLWSTQYVYDDHSLLSGDFLRNGLRLDLLCDATVSIPFMQIFSCMQHVLAQVAECSITQLDVICEPYSVSSRTKIEEVDVNCHAFSELKSKAVHTPVGRFSSIHYKIIERKQIESLFGEKRLPNRQYQLEELALFIDAIWFEYVKENLRNVEKSYFVGIALLVSGCVSDTENSNRSKSDYIGIVLSQDDHELLVSEDSAFRTFLNNFNGNDDLDVPVPQWNSFDFELGRPIDVHVENCPALDVLEAVMYGELDESGRPRRYEYVLICGPDSETSCSSNVQVLPGVVRGEIAMPTLQYFALSGICVGYGTHDARSFISFYEKDKSTESEIF